MTSTPDVIALLQDMVRIQSIHPAICGIPDSERKLAEWVESKLFEFGIGWRRLPISDERGFQVMAVIPGTVDNAPVLLFDSHLDTVGTEGMTIDPFAGDIHEGKLYGRGSCDTKGTGAALLGALKSYASESIRPNTVWGLFSVGEEAGMDGIRHFCEETLPSLQRRPALAIAGEPTELAVLAAHNGALRMQMDIRGQACHSSVPHMGHSAIDALAHIIPALKSYHEALPEDMLCGKAACSMTQIKGGHSPNVIPDCATATIDRRLGPGESAEEVFSALNEHLQQTTAPLEGISLTLTHLSDQPPLAKDERVPYDQLRDILSEHGQRWPLLGAGFCTHAGHLQQAGLPTIVCGPGGMHKAHSADEWVDTDMIVKGVDAYAAIMRASFLPS